MGYQGNDDVSDPSFRRLTKKFSPKIYRLPLPPGSIKISDFGDLIGPGGEGRISAREELIILFVTIDTINTKNQHSSPRLTRYIRLYPLKFRHKDRARMAVCPFTLAP